MTDKNDPKITAYALGELNEEERAEIESAISASPELQQEVDAIRETASLLEAGFAADLVDSDAAKPAPPSRVATVRPRSKQPKIKRSWTAFAAMVTALGLLVGFFVASFVADQRESSRRATAANQLIQQGQGVHSYHDTHRTTAEALSMREFQTEELQIDALSALEGRDLLSGVETQPQADHGRLFGRANVNLATPGIIIGEDEPLATSETQPSVEEESTGDGEQQSAQFPRLIADESETDSGELAVGEQVVIQQYTVQVPNSATRTESYAVTVPYTEMVDGKQVTRYRTETRTRAVPVTSMKSEIRERRVVVGRDGKILRALPGKKKTEPKTADAKSWKRVKATPNTSRLMVGDKDELEMQGMQVRVKVDGFRARVMLDCMYYNDRDQQLEGSFKLRLPNDASLFYFAFGESAYQYSPDLKPKDFQQELIKHEFRGNGKESETKENEYVSFSLDGIRADRADAWQNVKESRVVPREKAAFAYGQTVRRKVDPALVEWASAGVFNAKVFPLAPQKMHRIVIGYDVNLELSGDQLMYRLDLPEKAGATRVDVDFAQLAPSTDSSPFAISSPTGTKPVIRDGRVHYRIDMPIESQLDFAFAAPEHLVLVSNEDADDQFFATRFTPELPVAESDGSSQAIFLVDTSLSSNPDRFNVWLDLLRETLNANRDSMQQFAVLFFNVDSHWWEPRFVENNEENAERLIEYCQSLSLEGATDVHAAFHRVASAAWINKNAKPDLFLLSDAAATWGETNLAMINHQLDKAYIESFFAYQTGLTGTDTRALNLLARKHGGAVFNVTNEAEIASAAIAHRKRPWQLKSIEAINGSDVMTAGRVSSVYPGQSLLIVGRGNVGEDSDDEIVLEFERGDETKTVRVPIRQRIESELAERIYGQVSVGQLESLGRFTEEVSVAYARHFRVPGQTCSLLMLESEADYQRFNIKPEDDRFVVNSSRASALIEKKLVSVRQRLADPKLEMLSWLERLEKSESLQFELPTALRIAIDDVPTPAFEVSAFLPECKSQTRGEKIDIVKLAESYDEIQKLAATRREQHGTIDALRTLSNLVERNPGNPVLLRDIAFTAMEWEHPEAAYHLLRRVAIARPYEGHVYTALGQCLTDLEHTELAMIFYEIAINGQFPRGGADFRKIATVEYISMLKDIVEGRRMTAIPDYARSRYDSLKSSVGFESADLVVSMMWNTDRNDVDLHVVEPGGEECFYSHPDTKMGGHITQDITTGFGPEMYHVKNAKPGTFTIRTKYFGSDALRSGVRSKVLLTIYENFGTESQTQRRETITLEKTGEVVQVATVKVSEKQAQ